MLAGHPDLIKIFLLDARESPPPMPDTGLPDGHGLRPSVVAAVVRRAHAAGLRVAAHIETAADAAIVVGAGGDMLAHLPGYEMPLHASRRTYELPDSLARAIADRGVTITPTVSWAFFANGPDSAAMVAERRALQRRNIALLLAYHARFAVGSDQYGSTARVEVDALRALGLWDNLGLIQLWAVATPQSIFPMRRIGRLVPGYEASFLVMRRDPIADFDGALRSIALRVKQGCLVTP